MNVTLHLILCGVLVVITACVYLYRRWLENHDDPYIHLHNDSHDSGIITTQTTLAKRLDTIDKLKHGLVAAVILYILTIVAIVTYNAWNNPPS